LAFSDFQPEKCPLSRKESLKAYGNAIVPQVAFEIFKVIDAMGG
jgi:hypothetical protein